jgi:hypothetical protein
MELEGLNREARFNDIVIMSKLDCNLYIHVFQGRARLMYTAGYKSLSSVASAKTEDLVKSVQYMPRKAAKQIIASAKVC